MTNNPIKDKPDKFIDTRVSYNNVTLKVISKEFYKKWLEEYPEYSNISYNLWEKYWLLLADEYTSTILSNPIGVDLPYHNGTISIMYSPNKVDPVIKSNLDISDDIISTNLHSRRRLGKIVYSTVAFNKFIWSNKFTGYEPFREFNKNSHIALTNNPELFKVNQKSSTQKFDEQNNIVSKINEEEDWINTTSEFNFQ